MIDKWFAEDIEKILKEKREHLIDLRLGLASGKIKNVREVKETKKDIARILTILRITNQNELRIKK
ncbi:MAG: 50S ribosomal protein L29 [Desulfobacterales bacterium]|nr:50S ribosomal protein L29 [Desulfobacterales bacterium]